MKTIMIVTLAKFLLFFTFVRGQHQNYSFPDGFMLGTATASYQVEGAWNESDKGESIWDYAVHNENYRFAGGATGDVACDSYHKYRDDVQMLKYLNCQFYRFSISWPRILPTGKIDSINQDGIDYYNNLINELIENGIEPYVTLYHWDLPQSLQVEGGWVERKISDYYLDYAKLLFETFGDRVKMWMTFNEVIQICEHGYSGTDMAPFLDNEGIGGYQCTHTVLLAHAKTYALYNDQFRAKQNGKLGIAIDSDWMEPASDSEADKDAAETGMQMNYGWFMNPLVYGNYPEIMIERIANKSFEEGFNQSRLPVFTDEEKMLLKGSFDFFGLNHYSTNLATWQTSEPQRPSHSADVGIDLSFDPSWKPSAEELIKDVPWGLRKLLVWIKDEYGNPPILITENGWADVNDKEDRDRIDYYRGYMYEMLRAIHEEGCNVIGYTAWSLMDNFEWLSGYTQRFGLFYVDFTNAERSRTPKLSAMALKDIYEKRFIDWDYNPTFNNTNGIKS